MAPQTGRSKTPPAGNGGGTCQPQHCRRGWERQQWLRHLVRSFDMGRTKLRVERVLITALLVGCGGSMATAPGGGPPDGGGGGGGGGAGSGGGPGPRSGQIHAGER